jgi:acyl-CoA synthetase (AMP-forming)/AMP-acid ligase II
MTILQLLEDRRRFALTAQALAALDVPPLDSNALCSHVRRTAVALRKRSIERDDVVAVVMPNGPQMATAFLGVSAAAICAPLNPAYTADEFAFYLSDLPAKALLIASTLDSPARTVANMRGIPVLEATWNANDAAGLFSLDGSSDDSDDDSDAASDGDIALVLHTSGTTSRPKMVPLTHANLCASARNIARALDLTRDDRCLNVMPLFHIHGLVGALLSSLAAGGSVVCTPGFTGVRFFDWLERFEPTWYTAVPTMHRSVVSRASGYKSATNSLRFIRSSSAALPRATRQELEQIFQAPVIEAYGMTEAAHQIASNPLPPRLRKDGTVGIPAGPEVVVLDTDNQRSPAGVRGEIAIRGSNVTRGYVRNADANTAAFTDGWLRTGDEGVLDEDGYLTLLGRLKEVINRGGEKISPLEVDDALMAHPAVEQAITFPAPHASLGEEVAAAAVLRPNMSVSEGQLREFVGMRLAHFKVPKRVIFVDSIPLGPTGKPQRAGLAQRLDVSIDSTVTTSPDYVAPRTAVEEILAGIWVSLMRSETVGVNENFFYAGGDSALAAQFVARVRDTLSIDMSLLTFFDNPTIATLASVVDSKLAQEREVPTHGDAEHSSGRR